MSVAATTYPRSMVAASTSAPRAGSQTSPEGMPYMEGSSHHGRIRVNQLIWCSMWRSMLTDVHQHIWTEPLLERLAARERLPFVRRTDGVTVLHSAAEQPYVIDVEA